MKIKIKHSPNMIRLCNFMESRKNSQKTNCRKDHPPSSTENSKGVNNNFKLYWNKLQIYEIIIYKEGIYNILTYSQNLQKFSVPFFPIYKNLFFLQIAQRELQNHVFKMQHQFHINNTIIFQAFWKQLINSRYVHHFLLHHQQTAAMLLLTSHV